MEFRRNYGQTAAIAAGIDYALGDLIALIDADLEEDPADILRLVARIGTAKALILFPAGVRRKDAFLTRTLPSRMANSLISWVTGVRLHDYGCTLKVYRAGGAARVRLYGEMHRFIPAWRLCRSADYRSAGQLTGRAPRAAVQVRPGPRTIKVVLDLFTVKFLLSLRQRPLQLFGGVGSIAVRIGGRGCRFS